MASFGGLTETSATDNCFFLPPFSGADKPEITIDFVREDLFAGAVRRETPFHDGASMPSTIGLVFVQVNTAAYRLASNLIRYGPVTGLMNLVSQVPMVFAVFANEVQVNRHRISS
jgi:hypothetical protein